MTYKTSLFNKGLIINDLKRFWWVGVIHTLALIFIIPFQHLSTLNQIVNSNSDSEWIAASLHSSLRLASRFQITLICIIPVVIAVVLFRYMQTSRSASMMHSLPCSRSTHYFSHTFAGLLLIISPVVFTGVVQIIIYSLTRLKDYYSISQIFWWLGVTVLFNILFFATAVFVGMFTGNSIAHIAFSYILHILPAAIYYFIKFSLSIHVHGFNDDISTEVMLKFPFLALLENRLGNATYLSIYALVAATFLITSIFIYKIRKMETAGDIVTFPVMQHIFKYGVTFCAMLLCGMIFSSMNMSNIINVMIGYTTGSFIGYWVAEMLLQKSFKVWRAYKGYVVYIAIILVVLVGIKYDITGYVNRVPDAKDVQDVYLGNSITQWEFLKNPSLNKNRYMYLDNELLFESKENINNAILLHKHLINSKEKTGTSQCIIYTLKNGRHIIRKYIENRENSAAYYKPIYESMEYKKSRFPVIDQNPQDIKSIDIRDSRTPKKPAVISNVDEIKELTTLLREDIIKASYDDLNNQYIQEASLTINNFDEKAEPVNYTLRNNYTSVINWLKEKGYYNKVMLLPEEVEYVTLQHNIKIKDTNNITPIEIRDKAIIEELLDMDGSKVNYINNDIITASFYIKQGDGYYTSSITFPKDIVVSDSLRKYLDESDK